MCTRGRWWRPYRHTVSCRNERSSVETGLCSQWRIDLERERENRALTGLHSCGWGTSQARFPLHCARYGHTIWYMGLWGFMGAARTQIRNVCSCPFGVHCPCSLPLGTTDLLSVPLTGPFPEGPGNGSYSPSAHASGSSPGHMASASMTRSPLSRRAAVDNVETSRRGRAP